MTVEKDLGVGTDNDYALMLIDYQNEMFEVIRSERAPNLPAHDRNVTRGRPT
jgi:hypothetical protein